MFNTTIVALATPYLKSAIQVIRVSGSQTYEIVQRLTDKIIDKSANTVQLLKFHNNNIVIDEVLLIKFIAPKSFTGEDLIEINCHGNLLIVDEIISNLLKHGATLAKPGEFLQRAFMNQKISLLQAEAVNDLINSTNSYALNQARQNSYHKMDSHLEDFEDELFNLMGLIEIDIDYPEYDEQKPELRSEVIKFSRKWKQIWETSNNQAKVIEQINEGFNIAIIGQPNAGKSSLLNALAGSEKAIVHQEAGTTRDLIEVNLRIKDWNVKVIDTAGLRETSNQIEKIGVNLALEVLKKVDLIIYLIDIKNSDEDKFINEITKKYEQKVIKVYSKSDLNMTNIPVNSIQISSAKNELSQLVEKISEKLVVIDKVSDSSISLTNSRQRGLAEAIIVIFESILETDQGVTIDQLQPYLLEMLILYKQLIGKELQENELLDQLFRRFCLGK